jgi:hypothetical protein
VASEAYQCVTLWLSLARSPDDKTMHGRASNG